MKRLLASLLAVCATVWVLGLAASGALAALSDTETSAGNTFTAGTLLLTVGGAAAGTGTTVGLPTIGPLQRGGGGTVAISLQNAGTIDGVLSIAVTAIADYENGAAPGEAGDTGEPGELSQVLEVTMACGGAPLAPAARLSTWAGSMFGPVELRAGETQWLEIGWTMPDAAESDSAMGDTADLGLVFTLTQRP